MSWVFDIINNMPEFLSYVVPGYIFLTLYQYILFKDEKASEQTAAILLNSLVVSFIIKTAYDGLYNMVIGSESINTTGYFLGITGLSVILAYCASQIVKSKTFTVVKRLLGVNRTVNDNLWDDIYQPGIWIRVWLPDSSNSYYGQIKLLETYSREPLVLLEYYQYLDKYAKPIVDNTDDPKRTVLLNLSQFERIEIVEE